MRAANSNPSGTQVDVIYFFISHLGTSKLRLDLFKQDSQTRQMLMTKMLMVIFGLYVIGKLVTRLGP